VAEKTMAANQEQDMPESTLETLININLQISEGLLEGAENGEAREPAMAG